MFLSLAAMTFIFSCNAVVVNPQTHQQELITVVRDTGLNVDFNQNLQRYVFTEGEGHHDYFYIDNGFNLINYGNGDDVQLRMNVQARYFNTINNITYEFVVPFISWRINFVYDSNTSSYLTEDFSYHIAWEYDWLGGAEWQPGFNYIPYYDMSYIFGFSPVDTGGRLSINYMASAYMYSSNFDTSGDLNFPSGVGNFPTLKYITLGNTGFTYFEEETWSYLSGIPSDLQDAYNQGREEGYDIGYDSGKRDGYQEGYQEGYEEGADVYAEGGMATAIFANIIQVGMLPVNLFLSIFNFEVFGINIGAIVSGLLTLCITIIILRAIKGNGGSE